MSIILSSLAGAGWQFLDNNAGPLTGGLLYVYTAGTTTPVTTYTSSSGATPNANPIVLDSAGRVPEEIWVTYGGKYKFVLKTSTGTQIWSKDNISGVNDITDVVIPLTQTTFTSAGTNAVTRTGQAKVQEPWFSVLDFGATGTATFAGGGTDDTVAFQRAINAAWAASQTGNPDDYGGTVYVPPGQYLIAGSLTIYPTIKFCGGGMYSTKLIAPAASTQKVLYVDASVAPYSSVAAFPTAISDIAVLGATGGSLSATGIYLNKNGCFVKNVWVNGFGNGVVINNTDCFLCDFAAEFNTYGVVVLQPAATITNGTVYQNAVGVYVNNLLRMTAVSGGASTVVFPATATDPAGATISTAVDAFVGYVITIVSGTGAGQQRKISSYTGGTRTAVVSSAWTTPPDATSVLSLELDTQSVVISDIRAANSNQEGFYIYRSHNVQLSNCSATGNDTVNVLGALRVEESVNVMVPNFRASCGIYGGDASTTKDGIRLINSTLVSLSGGESVFWRNGVLVDACQNVSINGFQSNSNTLRGVYINGGGQITVNGGTFSNNGTTGGASDCGIESNNTAAGAIHTISGVTCDGTGGVQDYGVIATLSGSGRTFISGGTNALNNNTAPYLLTDSAGNGLIFTQNSFPSTRTVPTVASAATITIPAWAAMNGTVIVSGTTGITSITAGGYSGAQVTLIFSGALTVTDGSNLKLASNYTTTADDTLTLVCDGTNWYEVARSVN